MCLSQTSRVDYEYDARGQLSKQTTYARVDASGNGLLDGGQAVMQSVYDRAGQLLTSIDANGGTTHYTYDGLGRVVTLQDAENNVTSNYYDDAQNRTTIVSASGLQTTSVYDQAGRLIAVQQSSSSNPDLGLTLYVYDGQGQRYLKLDPTGVMSGKLYDERGRVIADLQGLCRPAHSSVGGHSWAACSTRRIVIALASSV